MKGLDWDLGAPKVGELRDLVFFFRVGGTCADCAAREAHWEWERN